MQRDVVAGLGDGEEVVVERRDWADHHWYNEVLFKRFLTPFRDGVLNRR
jgi:hypothetical protein